MGTMKISVADAKNKLPKLIKAVEDGEAVTICRRGKPVVDMIRTSKSSGQRPAFGTLKGKVTVLDQGWWKPLTPDQADEFIEGR